MRILLIKTSSLGDVIHNLPVLSDLRANFPDAQIDWCVEEAFADIPRLHPALNTLIPVALRRWRKNLAAAQTWREIKQFKAHLQAHHYDAIIDTQGLIKSSLIARVARLKHNGARYGYAAGVAREALAARAYDQGLIIPLNVHALIRNRWLVQAALNTPVDTRLDYGISAPRLDFAWLANVPKIAVLLSAASRANKLWAEENWQNIALYLRQRGYTAVLPSGNALERQRAERIASQVPGAIVAPPLSLRELAALLGKAHLAIGVDTGLTHLAAALKTPVIALYTSTDPTLTGVFGTGFTRNLGNKGAPPSVNEVLIHIQQALLIHHKPAPRLKPKSR